MKNMDHILSQIEEALESVRPFLQQDGGDVKLMGIDEDYNVTLKLLGACSSCSINHLTMKAGIEEAIKKVVPQVKNVTAIKD